MNKIDFEAMKVLEYKEDRDSQKAWDIALELLNILDHKHLPFSLMSEVIEKFVNIHYYCMAKHLNESDWKKYINEHMEDIKLGHSTMNHKSALWITSE